MPNVLQNAAAWLGAELKRLAARTVVIQYSDVQTDELTGWCSRQQYEVIDAEGFATSMLSYDWQFVVEDLPTDLLQFEGLLIVEGYDKYEAMPLGNRPWYEQLDSTGQIVTIHTKQVS